MIVALLPVKDLWQAKQRLAPLLSQSERRQLCLAMLEDVLGALRSARLLSGTLVYSPDEDALDLARCFGAHTEFETNARGQSEAVVGALPYCLARGAKSVVTIPLDAPLLTGQDVDALITFSASMALPPPSAVIVPSADGTGTNSLLLTPLDALPPRFGPDSLARHLALADELRVASLLFHSPRLALDVDSPADLATFLAAAERGPGEESKTYQYLLRARLADRVRAVVE